MSIFGSQMAAGAALAISGLKKVAEDGKNTVIQGGTIAGDAIVRTGAKIVPWSAPVLRVKRLSSTATMPTRGSERAIGYDLYADLGGEGRKEIIGVGERARLSTNIAVGVPVGYYGRVAPRSGLAFKNGIVVLGGVVDEDYRGHVFVLLLNTDRQPFTVAHGDRIAQLILEAAAIVPVSEVDDLDDTARGEAGFGSTGA